MDELGEVTRTSQLGIVSSPDPDPAYQWDTKRKLFNLAEVCAQPSTVLVLIAITKSHLKFWRKLLCFSGLLYNSLVMYTVTRRSVSFILPLPTETPH